MTRDQPDVCSYHASCSDQAVHARQAVWSQCFPQAGHTPRVSNVFHRCPHPGLHIHRSVFAGCQPQTGHLIRKEPESTIHGLVRVERRNSRPTGNGTSIVASVLCAVFGCDGHPFAAVSCV